jgi:hypothetical protein
LPWIIGAFAVSALEITHARLAPFGGFTDPLTGLFQMKRKEENVERSIQQGRIIKTLTNLCFRGFIFISSYLVIKNYSLIVPAEV